MPLNIPNVLTLLRILLIPVFVLFFYLPVEWSKSAAALVFAVAAFTDWLDGYLARRLGEVSNFGAFLDPVADKLIVTTALVLLVGENPSEYADIWLTLPAAVIIGREITISALREWMAELGAHATVAVNWVGKVKTSAQLLALLLLIYQQPFAGVSSIGPGVVLLYIAAALTLWSMVIYLRAAWPVISKKS